MKNSMSGFVSISAKELNEESILYAHPLEKIEKNEPVTVGEIIKILQNIDEDLPMYFMDDNASIMGVCDIGKSDKAVYLRLF